MRPRGGRSPLGIAAGLALLGLVLSSSPLLAQRMDSFEGGAPRWQLVESDCQAQLTEHEISLLMPHAGRTCEMFEVACRTGRFVLLAYPIEPCVALNEFQPRVWTRCSSGRIQLGVRVVFPMAEHPITLGRLNTILWGDFYSETGQWQMLQVTELQRHLQESIVALRQEFGAELPLEGAFIDSLVINAYTGPGRYRVQLDDLDLRGMVPLAATGVEPQENWREKWRWRYATPTREERFWATANRPPVWLQYQGEPFPWLQSLGFTGLLLNKLPSQPQLARIQDAALSVISPPPPHSLTIDQEIAPVIKGWLVGAALDSRQADLAREQVRLVQQMPPQLQRPLVGEALEQFWMFSRIADQVIVPVPTPASAGSPRDKLAWLARQLTTTRQRGQGWVSINVGETPATLEQYRTAMHALGESPGEAGDLISTPEAQESPPCNPLGLRHQATGAVIAGAQGLLFRTFRPLNLQGAADSANVAALRWINNDLTLWGPWILAGQASQAPSLSRDDYTAGAWSVSDSQLIVAQTMASDSQFCIPATSGSPLRLDLTTVNSRQVLRLTEGALERMQVESTPAGASWVVQRPAPIEIFVATDNPRVLGFLRSKLESMAIQNASDQLEIAAYNLTLAGQVTEARFPASDSTAENLQILTTQTQQLAVAQRQIDRGWQALRSNQARTAARAAFEASDAVQAMLFDAQQVATSNLATPQASPFVMTPPMLGLHWKLARACERSVWRELPLPGAQLADLQVLLESGWSQQRRLEERVDLRVEIVPPTSQRGGGLRLAAYRKGNEPGPEAIAGGYEGASLRVRSAAAPVRAGQLIRVSAVAHVLRATTQADSGLLVYDNQAGPSLGQLVRGDVGDRIDVELYRFATSDGEFRVLAECRGECDIVLESIRASVIEPATDRSRFPISPLGALPPPAVVEVFEP